MVFPLNPTSPQPISSAMITIIFGRSLASTPKTFDVIKHKYVGEHDNYVAAFDGAMSIPDMQRYSLVYKILKIQLEGEHISPPSNFN